MESTGNNDANQAGGEMGILANNFRPNTTTLRHHYHNSTTDVNRTESLSSGRIDSCHPSSRRGLLKSPTNANQKMLFCNQLQLTAT